VATTSVRGAMARNLFLLIAALATLVLLGCWDNRREMQRVLEQGYAANAEIVGASFQRWSPVVLEDWRPRFVEQEVAVDMQWRGRDGKTYRHAKVPVSERFAGMVVVGDKVKLMTVPVKVLDDESSVPVPTFDAANRFDSLGRWIEASGYIAVAALAVLAGMNYWRWRRGSRPAIAAAPSRPLRFPAQRTMIGIAALGVGAFLAYSAWSIGDDAGEGGNIEITAEITLVTSNPYAVQLGWKDPRGGVHHYGPVPISERFWKEITSDGALVLRETRVRIRADDPMSRPVILADAPEKQWRTRTVLGVGCALLALGAGCLMSAVRAMRRFL